MKESVIIKEHYVMYIELFNKMAWFHTDVFKWSSKVKKEFMEDLQTLKRLTNIPLLAFIEEENVKLNKFAKSIGMEQMQKLVSKDGAIAHIYCWR